MGTGDGVPGGCQPCPAAGGKGLLSALAAGVFSLTARQSCGGEDGAGGGIQGTSGETNRRVKRQRVGLSQEHNGSCLRGVFSSALMRGKYLEVSCCPSPMAGATGRWHVPSTAHLGWENLATGFLLRKQVPFPACPWSDALAGAAMVPVLSVPLLVQRAPGQWYPATCPHHPKALILRAAWAWCRPTAEPPPGHSSSLPWRHREVMPGRQWLAAATGQGSDGERKARLRAGR